MVPHDGICCRPNLCKTLVERVVCHSAQSATLDTVVCPCWRVACHKGGSVAYSPCQISSTQTAGLDRHLHRIALIASWICAHCTALLIAHGDATKHHASCGQTKSVARTVAFVNARAIKITVAFAGARAISIRERRRYTSPRPTNCTTYIVLPKEIRVMGREQTHVCKHLTEYKTKFWGISFDVLPCYSSLRRQGAQCLSRPSCDVFIAPSQ